MARFREQPCKNYICEDACAKGRIANYKGYCQHCDLYVPRAHVKTENMKKKKLDKIMENYYT